MNWIKENKFLTGYFAVLAVGLGVLGFLLFSASSAYDAANDNYVSKANEYKRLRSLQPYPNQESLKKYEAQKSEAADMVTAFQAQLATREFKSEDMSPAEFQDKLKASVTEIVGKAEAAGVALPKGNGASKFYLGFDPYESRPPEREAVAPLVRQLKAIQWVVEQVIDNHITSLDSLERTPLPEEKSLSTGNSRRQNQNQNQGERGGSRELVIKNPLDLRLTAKQETFGKFLNTIVGTKAPQFYIPRIVRVRNQKMKGPDRATAGIPSQAVGAAGGAAPAVPDVPIGFIVGDEQVEVELRLEIVEFVAPKTKGEKGEKGVK